MLRLLIYFAVKVAAFQGEGLRQEEQKLERAVALSQNLLFVMFQERYCNPVKCKPAMFKKLGEQLVLLTQRNDLGEDRYDPVLAELEHRDIELAE